MAPSLLLLSQKEHIDGSHFQLCQVYLFIVQLQTIRAFKTINIQIKRLHSFNQIITSSLPEFVDANNRKFQFSLN